jgi:HD superfamily phosphohydrolase
MIRIRDPIHGTIGIATSELPVVDSRVYQRLRGIKQLGFTDQAFPGATHTRYAHGLGAMGVATRMFDALFPPEGSPLPAGERARLRQLVRLAVLLHDVGHAPASHASESLMPPRHALDLPCFTPEEAQKRASHEDYTLLLILRSDLRAVLERGFADQGITPEDIGHLITGRLPERAPSFLVGGVDWYPLLGQIVSGEMDADRMDYLQRDSFYAGVTYGKFDEPWLMENLAWHVVDGAALMALSHRAVFAFEDFLLSRFHMFVSVYYHYVPVGFDSMLVRFYREAPGDFSLPTDADAYAATDDVTLWSALRASRNPWAQRIAYRQSFRRVLELNADTDPVDVEAVLAALNERRIEHFTSVDKGVLSSYYGPEGVKRPIYVINDALGQAVRMDAYSRIYERYAQPARLFRIYCRPDQAAEARSCVASFTRPPA